MICLIVILSLALQSQATVYNVLQDPSLAVSVAVGLEVSERVRPQ